MKNKQNYVYFVHKTNKHLVYTLDQETIIVYWNNFTDEASYYTRKSISEYFKNGTWLLCDENGKLLNEIFSFESKQNYELILW